MILTIYASEAAPFEKDSSAPVLSGYYRFLTEVELYQVYDRIVRHPAKAGLAAGPVCTATPGAEVTLIKISFNNRAIVLLR